MAGPSVTGQPRRLWNTAGRAGPGTVTAAGNFVVTMYNLYEPTAQDSTDGLIYLDPDDLAVYNKVPRLETQVLVATASVSPGGAYYSTIYAASITGLSGAVQVVLGTEVPGARSATRTMPAALTVGTVLKSPDFACPAAGLYVMVVNFSAAFAATSHMAWAGALTTLSR